MPKNTSKDKANPERPVKLFNPSSANSPETSPLVDSDSKLLTPESPSLEESKTSFNKLLTELVETRPSESPVSDSQQPSDPSPLFPKSKSSRKKSVEESDSLKQSQSETDEEDHTDQDRLEEDLTQSPDSNQEAYHLLVVPPEGSLVGETYDTPQEVLAAILRHSQVPLVMGELDAWGIHVFYGKRVDLLGDVRTGRVALRVGDQTHVLNDDTEMPRTMPGTFQPISELATSSSTEPANPSAMDFSMFEREDRLF